MDTLPLHIRGGSIFPLQYEARNTEQSTRNPWIILVALDDDENASGSLFTDDGISENTVDDGAYLLVSVTLSYPCFGFTNCRYPFTRLTSLSWVALTRELYRPLLVTHLVALTPR